MFYNKSLSAIARGAIAKSKLYYKKCVFLKYRKMSLKEYTICNDDNRAYAQLMPFYDDVSGTGRK